MSISNEFKIWLAGFFDGEGCISIGRTRNTILIRVCLTNTNLKVLELIKSYYGGDIWINSRNAKDHPEWKIGYNYRIQWNRAIVLLKDIYPYLQVKKEVAELAIDFYHSDDCIVVKRPTENAKYRVMKILSPEAVKRRQNIIDNIKRLNKKGNQNCSIGLSE